METLYLVKAWRMLLRDDFYEETGDEWRLFSTDEGAREWLKLSHFVQGEYEPAAYAKEGEYWYHEDSTKKQYVIAELREIQPDDPDDSKFTHLAIFP